MLERDAAAFIGASGARNPMESVVRVLFTNNKFQIV